MGRHDPNIDDRLLSRIQKLLALADPQHNDSQAQIDAALVKVSQLLEKHSITMQDVEEYKAGSNELVYSTAPVRKVDLDGVISHDKFDAWVINLGSAIANACYCKAIFGPGILIFVGLKRDVDIACFMMMNLVQRLLNLSDQEARVYRDELREVRKRTDDIMIQYKRRKPDYIGDTPRRLMDPILWRQNWLEGASMSLGLRISEARRRERRDMQRAAASNTRAIVTLHEDKINDFLKQEMPWVGSDPIPEDMYEAALNNAGAYHQGLVAGQKIQIQRGVGTTDNHDTLPGGNE